MLADLAALLAKQLLDGQGGMRPVENEERVGLFADLRRAHPADFERGDAIRCRWHREQALASELAMDWDAAVFHWERATQIKPESRNQESEIRDPKSEVAVESRLAYARQAAEVVRLKMLEGGSRWSSVLPRPPWATPEMLDLSSHYMLSLGEPLVTGRPDTSFRGLGDGVQVLNGTGFDVRGIIHLKLTNHVTIPVGRACQRLHFLHAASQPAPWARETVGTYLVTFANGSTNTVRLLNPEDLQPYSAYRFLTNAVPELKSRLVWSGSSSGLRAPPETFYLTRTTWELPAAQRGETIESLELRAGSGKSAPLIFAITIE
jgi:hypothetical protein